VTPYIVKDSILAYAYATLCLWFACNVLQLFNSFFTWHVYQFLATVIVSWWYSCDISQSIV